MSFTFPYVERLSRFGDRDHHVGGNAHARLSVLGAQLRPGEPPDLATVTPLPAGRRQPPLSSRTNETCVAGSASFASASARGAGDELVRPYERRIFAAAFAILGNKVPEPGPGETRHQFVRALPQGL
jgi:hypothetical protein